MFLSKDTGKSQYWQIIYEVNGKRTKKSTRTANRKEAEKVLQLFRTNYSDLELNRVIIDKIEDKFMIEDFKKEYETFMSGYGSTSYVERSIKPAFKELIDFTGNIPLKQLDAKTLEKFLISVYKRSKYTAANHYRSLKSAFNKALSWNYIDRNFLKDFKLPKIQRPETLFASFEEIQKIVENIQFDIIKEITLFAFFTGLRAGEIVSLTWKNIKFNEKLIQVGSNEFTTKSRRIRYIPISDPVMEILLKVKPKILNKNDFVFPKENGKCYTVDRVSKMFKEAVKNSEVNQDIHFHTLRSSFGSYLLQKGVPIQMISKLLGHSSIAITEAHYASLTVGNLFEAVTQFNQLKAYN